MLSLVKDGIMMHPMKIPAEGCVFKGAYKGHLPTSFCPGLGIGREICLLMNSFSEEILLLLQSR